MYDITYIANLIVGLIVFITCLGTGIVIAGWFIIQFIKIYKRR